MEIRQYDGTLSDIKSSREQTSKRQSKKGFHFAWSKMFEYTQVAQSLCERNLTAPLPPLAGVRKKQIISSVCGGRVYFSEINFRSS